MKRWALVFLLAVTAVGCIRFRGPEDLRREISREAGVVLEKETGITVTRSGVALARIGMRIAGKGEYVVPGVRRVEVGVYEVQGLRDGVDAPQAFDLPLLEGWERVLRVRDEGEQVFMLARVDDDEIVRNMLLVVAEEDEWVLVRLRGKLNRALEKAVELAFREADRPELLAQAEWEEGWDPERDSAPTSTR